MYVLTLCAVANDLTLVVVGPRAGGDPRTAAGYRRLCGIQELWYVSRPPDDFNTSLCPMTHKFVVLQRKYEVGFIGTI